MKSYTIKELMELKAIYLESLSPHKDSWYVSPQAMADQELADFFGWLNIRENTP